MAAMNPRVAAYKASIAKKPTPAPVAKKVPVPAPTGKKTPMPNPTTAMAALIKEREAYAKSHGGNWPSDEQLMKSRKKK